MKIGIMGGTFNPVHNAHLLIAERAYETLGLDRVWFMPNCSPPHKDSRIPSGEIRYEMTSAAAEGNPHFEVSAFELECGGVSYTAETLAGLKRKYPDTVFYLIIGSDSLRDFDKWYKPEVIASLCIPAVYPRYGDDTARLIKEYKYQNKPVAIDAPMVEISSTDIRNRIKNGLSVRYMLPESVLKIIEREHLYK